MTNAEQFKKTFGIYAEEFWSYTGKQMLVWINTDVPDTNIGDMISRQAAIDEIKEIYEWHDNVTKERIIEHFKQLPSAQPEIIRCKDCKHYQFADNRALGMPVKICEWFGFKDVDDDDFCSRAERKTNE